MVQQQQQQHRRHIGRGSSNVIGGTKRPIRAQSSFIMGAISGILLTVLIMTNLHHDHHQNQQQQNRDLASFHQLQRQQNNNVGDEIPGWHTIHVYYGQRNALQHIHDKNFNSNNNDVNNNHPKWYGQVHQDQIVVQRLLKNLTGGFFLDLAANHAYEFSNTYALEQSPYNWKGLCIEPNPTYWYSLSHRTCTVVGALVGKDSSSTTTDDSRVPVQFRGVYGGIVGKMDSKLANRKREPRSKTEYRYMTSLLDVLQQFRVPPVIHYMSLDVEGAELLVMQNFPIQQYSIKIMTIERPRPELRRLLEHDYGFVFLKELAWWGETLWAHKSMGLSPHDDIIKAIPTEERK